MRLTPLSIYLVLGTLALRIVQCKPSVTFDLVLGCLGLDENT